MAFSKCHTLQAIQHNCRGEYCLRPSRPNPSWWDYIPRDRSCSPRYRSNQFPFLQRARNCLVCRSSSRRYCEFREYFRRQGFPTCHRLRAGCPCCSRPSRSIRWGRCSALRLRWRVWQVQAGTPAECLAANDAFSTNFPPQKQRSVARAIEASALSRHRIGPNWLRWDSTR